jgi:NAD(P)-dependent dehydrogenase (short-subunit alcohol dehydrogenase family)
MDWRRLIDGKVALITGAAFGIGRATAQLFAQHGAKVAVIDVAESGGQSTVECIRKVSGEAFFLKSNVGCMDHAREMVEETLKRYARLDIVFSNAASYKMASTTDSTEDEWDRTQDVCLKATWMIAHYAMPAMLRNENGSFIITSSVQGIRGYRNHAAYQAAKGGLISLTRSLAADYAPKIRVNAILPGAVITGLVAGASESDLKKVAMMCPLQRNAQPEEIATTALFLASDMSSYMTGSCLVVDGGLTSVIKTD